MATALLANNREKARNSEPAFALQPVLDLPEPPFSGPKRRGAGMHRVPSEHEVVGVWSRRPKNELCVGLRMEVDRVMRGLEDRKLPGFHSLRALRDTNESRA